MALRTRPSPRTHSALGVCSVIFGGFAPAQYWPLAPSTTTAPEVPCEAWQAVAATDYPWLAGGASPSTSWEVAAPLTYGWLNLSTLEHVCVSSTTPPPNAFGVDFVIRASDEFGVGAFDDQRGAPAHDGPLIPPP
jgi:hypothetical protein